MRMIASPSDTRETVEQAVRAAQWTIGSVNDTTTDIWARTGDGLILAARLYLRQSTVVAEANLFTVPDDQAATMEHESGARARDPIGPFLKRGDAKEQPERRPRPHRAGLRYRLGGYDVTTLTEGLIDLRNVLTHLRDHLAKTDTQTFLNWLQPADPPNTD